MREEIRLRGAHNRENAMATAAVCLARGVPAAAVRAGLASFAGVAHRMEEIARVDGVLYVNDSKATNVASAVVAIESFPAGTVHAILGGRGKGSDYAPLRQPLTEHARAAYLIGETAAALRDGTGEHRRPAPRQRRPRGAPSRPPARPPGPATSCCSRRHVLRTTSTAPSSSAVTTSGHSSRIREGDRAWRRSQV